MTLPTPAVDDPAAAPHRAQVDLSLADPDPVATYGARVSRQIAKCRREGGQLALLWIELEARDSQGGPLGDEVNEGLAKLVCLRLRNRVRGSDDVQRVGSEGFAVLLLDGGAPEAGIVRQRLLHAIRGPYKVDNQRAVVSLRMGTALFPAAGRNGAELAAAARQSLDTCAGPLP